MNAAPEVSAIPGTVLPEPEALLSCQERSWLQAERAGRVGHRRAGSGSGSVNVFTAFRVMGALDCALLGRALTETLGRHEALRSRFVAGVDGQIRRDVAAAGAVPVLTFDVRRVPDAHRSDEICRLGTEAIVEPFDYASGVLLRGCVIQSAPDEHVVFIVVPHLVSDAVSLQIVVRETLILYAHFLHGLGSPLSPPARQYSEFVKHQRATIERERSRTITDYYVRRLAGARAVKLPEAQRVPPERAGPRAGHFDFEFPPTLTAEVWRRGKIHDVTPFIVLLSAFKVLLSVTSGETDILVLSHFLGRPEPFSDVVGLFAERCRLRTSLEGDPSFAEVVQRVRYTVIDAWAHQWIPYAVLNEVAEARRESLPPPTVAMNALPIQESLVPREYRALLAQCEITPYRLSTLDARVAERRTWTDIYVYTTIDASVIDNRLVYRADLFDVSNIWKLTSRFRTVLEAVLAEPAQPLSRLSRSVAAI